MAESEEELKSLEKVGLKLNIQKIKTMASSPITSWQIDGEAVEMQSLNHWTSRELPEYSLNIAAKLVFGTV